MTIHRIFFGALLIATVGLVVSVLPIQVSADDLQVSLKDGSVITIEAPDQSILWTDVLENGEMAKREILTSDILELVLSSSPASAQVTAIRGFLSDLASPEYAIRQNAEEQLSNPTVGGPFRSLIESQVDHNEFEVRYRISRIIHKLEGESEEAASEFDILTTKDGNRIEGDAGDFSFKGKFRGREMTFERAQIALLAFPPTLAESAKESEVVKVEMFHSHIGQFYLDGQEFVSFETSPSGHELPDKGDITGVFVPVGLKLGTENKKILQNERPDTKVKQSDKQTNEPMGFVGISGYGFKFEELPVGGKSVCVFEDMGTYFKRFRGVMEIEFCMPNQESVPAGVRELGLFASRVAHSRDIILEAYNADGHLLACVESTDKPCVFSGVKSNELITKIRILSNPHLFRVDRSIDNDFAVDSICYSKPEPVSSPQGTAKGLGLKNGDFVVSRDVKIDKAVHTSVAGTRINIELDEIDTMQFGRQELPPNTPTWVVLLKDGSLLHVKAGKRFSSTRFGGLDFDLQDIAAITISKNPIRLPAAGDFNKGKNVIVFPTCRIADKVAFSDTGFSWDKTATKIQQPLFTGKEDPQDEDPTPKISSIEYAEAWPENIPTVWLSPPKTQPRSAGKVRLVDGQQLSLGANSLFKLKTIAKEKIMISVDGKDKTLLMKDVLSIDLPDE